MSRSLGSLHLVVVLIAGSRFFYSDSLPGSDVRYRRDQRQDDREAAALVDFALQADRTTLQLHNFPGQRQAQSGGTFAIGFTTGHTSLMALRSENGSGFNFILPAATYLLRAFDAGKLEFFSSRESLRDRCSFLDYLAPLREAQWVVYAKKLSPDRSKRRTATWHVR